MCALSFITCLLLPFAGGCTSDQGEDGGQVWCVLSCLDPPSVLGLLIRSVRVGSPWHCIIGESFGFKVACETKHMLYLYYGNIAVMLYKC